jgi:hypothetical protein
MSDKPVFHPTRRPACRAAALESPALSRPRISARAAGAGTGRPVSHIERTRHRTCSEPRVRRTSRGGSGRSAKRESPGTARRWRYYERSGRHPGGARFDDVRAFACDWLYPCTGKLTRRRRFLGRGVAFLLPREYSACARPAGNRSADSAAYAGVTSPTMSGFASPRLR